MQEIELENQTRECRLVFKYVDLSVQPHIKIQSYGLVISVIIFLGDEIQHQPTELVTLAASMVAGAGPFNLVKCAFENMDTDEDIERWAQLFRRLLDENQNRFAQQSLPLPKQSSSSSNKQQRSTPQSPIAGLPPWHYQKNLPCYEQEEFDEIYARVVENFKNSHGHPILDMKTSKNARKLRNYINSVTSRRHTPKVVDLICLRLVADFGATETRILPGKNKAVDKVQK